MEAWYGVGVGGYVLCMYRMRDIVILCNCIVCVSAHCSSCMQACTVPEGHCLQAYRQKTVSSRGGVLQLMRLWE